MQHCDILILAGWCIPVEPHDLVLPDHGVAVTDGKIVELLRPEKRARNMRPASSLIGLITF